MARYIDADFVANGLREVLHKPKSEFPDDFEQTINCLVYAISILKFAPTADVAPVVRAHWETNKHAALDFCSNCGEAVERYITAEQMDKSNYKGATYWNYCPHCGAIMDEKEG